MTAPHLTDEAAHEEALREVALRARIHQEMADNLDEELELELDDIRLDELDHDGEAGKPSIDRKFYFRELLRLQGELVKLQDWVQHEKKTVSYTHLRAHETPEHL